MESNMANMLKEIKRSQAKNHDEMIAARRETKKTCQLGKGSRGLSQACTRGFTLVSVKLSATR